MFLLARPPFVARWVKEPVVPFDQYKVNGPANDFNRVGQCRELSALDIHLHYRTARAVHSDVHREQPSQIDGRYSCRGCVGHPSAVVEEAGPPFMKFGGVITPKVSLTIARRNGRVKKVNASKRLTM